MLPGMGGLDPQKMAQMQTISQYIKGEIRVDYAKQSVIISLSSVIPEAAEIIPQLLEQFSGALAQQLSAFFAIKGELVEVNKP